MGGDVRDQRVTVGRIIRPQGNRGQVVVAPETDFAERRFAPGTTFDVAAPDGPRTLTIVESRPHDARWVIGFAGVASIDDAERLRDVHLTVPAADVLPLEAGQYYLHDLEGCRVTTTRGLDVGTVERVEIATGTPLLVVPGREGEVLVPLAEHIIRSVDVEGRRIEIDPPEGLLALNATRPRGARRDED
jgi:16S rRNA processing protein RimM